MADQASFSIVGVGASAGGLEAFQELIREIPEQSGMAFVLIQHLDPEHTSLLTEILQRVTLLPVIEVRDQMPVRPDHVYVIPPNRDMTIQYGVLQLCPPEQPRGQRMPIDDFLISLANDQKNRAVGVILSGTGTDGTLGLHAIQEAGGISIAQEPSSAKYDGMPSSAITSGYATQVMTPQEMIHALMSQDLSDQGNQSPTPHSKRNSIAGIMHILLLLRNATGHDFSQYKKSTIRRRIERCMSIHSIHDTDEYAAYLKEHPAEMQLLLNELLINVTSFFRDPEAFQIIAAEILPLLFKNKNEGDFFRVWIAGCASGEEAYSIAILLREYMDLTHKEFKILIYATDLDEDSITEARAGVYAHNITETVTTERLTRYFNQEDGTYRVKRSIRDMVVFAVQNVIKDPPLIKLDLLCCRNLMIYLEPELQNRLIPIFHYALKPGGVLFLSPAESIGNHTERFNVLNRKYKLYQALATTPGIRNLMTTDSSWTASKGVKVNTELPKKNPDPNYAEITRRALLSYYSPASVLTDLKGLLLYVHGDTGKYLRPAPGQASLNVQDMAREGLATELKAAINIAGAREAPKSTQTISVNNTKHDQPIQLIVRRVSGSTLSEPLLLISFIEPRAGDATHQNINHSVSLNESSTNPHVDESSKRLQSLEFDLSYTRDNLRATIDEHQASNEELKSTNEELQSTNEELQSTNEELETSKEELQSVNEELVTVNTELQKKIEQLAGMQNDMKNLLDNMNIGTIFLDKDMVVRRFTREATRAYRLIPSDVGRALEDIKCELNGKVDLIAQAQEVLKSLNPFEVELFAQNGNWYLAHIQPYRTLENIIAGVVMTFTDITARVSAEAAVQTARTLAEGIVNTVLEPLVVLDASLKVVSASRSFYRYFHEEPESTIGRLIYDLGNQQWNISALRELLEKILPQQQSFEGYEMEHTFPNIGLQKMVLNARRIVDSGGNTQLILFAMRPLATTQA